MRPSERGIQNALLAACGAVGLVPTPASTTGQHAPVPAGVTAEHTTIPADAELPALLTQRIIQAREIMGLPRAQRVCLVLIDGMGYQQLAARWGHAPKLRALAQGSELGEESFVTSIAPSTTAAALTALATGELPGVTNMLGYALLAGDPPARFDLITFKNAPLPPELWQTQPTIFERLGAAAQRAVLVEDPKYHNSGLTNAAWRGAPARYAKPLPARVDAALAELTNGRELVYLYWGNLDHIGHKYGVDSAKWLAELETVDSEIGRLVANAPRDTLIIVTADHGMVADEQKIDIATSPTLAAGVTATAGEERAFQLYTRDPQAVARRWRDELGSLVWVLTKEQIATAGLFGKMSDRAAAAMGDVVAFARERTGFVDSRVLSPAAIAMRGVHGSLTPAEMQIPWIVALT